MTKRIFSAILAVAAAVLLLSFLVIFDVLYGYFSTLQKGQLQAELRIAAHGVQTDGVGWLDGLDTAGYRLTLVAPDGRVAFDSEADAAAMENHAGREEIAEALSVGSGESERMSATLTQKTIYQAVRLADGAVLRISTTQSSILSLVLGLLTPAIFVLAAAIVLSAVLANRLAKRIVKPLNGLDLEHPLENDAYEELSPLLTRIARQRNEIDRQVAELKRRQAEFSAVTGSMNEGLVLLNEQGAVLSINPAAQALFHTDGDCVGKDFLTVERSRGVESAVARALSDGHGETALLRDGRQMEIEISRIGASAQAAGAVLLAFDVTEKAQAEQLRREFAANVSHELKTPLQAILGSAELMENGLVKSADMPRFTGHIRTETTRLIALIDDILRLSRLDEGGELQREPVDLLATAKEAADRFADAAAARQVSLCVSGEPTVFCGVRRLLQEIAGNLIDNAVKYNREGGSVTVTVSEEAGFAVLTVSDTGVGIPKAHEARVFERFYRADKSHSKATGGTGLGLSIVKHAVETMHGQIALCSEPGVGTTVTARFPMA